MSDSNSFMPADPFELAAPRALRVTGSDFAMTHEDERLVAELDQGAAELGFHDQRYIIESSNAFIAPVSFDADKPVSIFRLDSALFEGDFVTYSKVHIGKLIGGSAVRALCLSFSEAMIMPYFAELEKEELIHVPVLAVDSISQTN